jgi:hypothetical protein
MQNDVCRIVLVGWFWSRSNECLNLIFNELVGLLEVGNVHVQSEIEVAHLLQGVIKLGRSDELVHYAVVTGRCLNRYRKGVLDFSTSDQVRFKEYSLSVNLKSFNLTAVRNNHYYQGCNIESRAFCVKAPREAS